jgi:membrane protein/epoxyqueuosine reductase
MVSLALILACGGLALLSLILTALNREWIGGVTGTHTTVAEWVNLLMFKLAAVPISMFSLFLVYWLLPNRKIDPRRVAPVAILIGLALEALKYVNLFVAPFLYRKLQREYSIFRHSAIILLTSFCAAMIVLAGARWSARVDSQDPISLDDGEKA